MKDPEKETADYLRRLGRSPGGVAGLTGARALLRALGDPQQRLRFIHLAGTNGKGSTAAMTAEMLRRAGYRTGLYTSPHLISFRERIRVDGVPIAAEELNRLTRRAAAALETLPHAAQTLGAFAFTTAVGLLYFAERHCSIVVLETGLGGRLDATNVIAPPEAAVITPISRDHTVVLGNTVEEIAWAKAGIIKRGSRVVCAPRQPAAALRVLGRVCAAQQVPFIRPAPARVFVCGLRGSELEMNGRTYRVGMLGRHQAENAQSVLTLAACLRRRGWEIPEDAVQAGLAETQCAGRMERVSDTPLAFVDGAHNPDGVRALCHTMDELLPGRTIGLVLGMARDKETAPCIRALASRAAVVFAAAAQDSRALPAADVAATAAQTGVRVERIGDVPTAWDAARQWADTQGCVIACGSLYLVGEVKRVLESRQNIAE